MKKVLTIVFATATVTAALTSCANQESKDLTSFSIGEKHFNVQVAEEKAEKEKGLMGVKHLPKDEGMVFKYTPAQRVSFWMKDTLIPLDLAWVKDGKVIGTVTMQPCVEQDPSNCNRWQSPGEVDYAVEVNAGMLDTVPFNSDAKFTNP